MTTHKTRRKFTRKERNSTPKSNGPQGIILPLRSIRIRTLRFRSILSSLPRAQSCAFVDARCDRGGLKTTWTTRASRRSRRRRRVGGVSKRIVDIHEIGVGIAETGMAVGRRGSRRVGRAHKTVRTTDLGDGSVGRNAGGITRFVAPDLRNPGGGSRRRNR